MKVLLTAPPRLLGFLKHCTEGIEHMSIDNFREPSGPPLAIYSLAAVLREHGHSVDILDPFTHKIKFQDTNKIDVMKISDKDLKEFSKSSLNYDEMRFPDLEKRINEVDVIGISSATLEWFLARVMAERIKSNDPEIPVVLGGIHATFAGEHALKTSKVDYVVRGEGEKTLPELLETIEKDKDLKDILGISYKNDGGVIINKNRPLLTVSELEDTPLPAFDLLPSNIHQHLPIETSRGCKFSCAFCSVPFKKIWRGLNPEAVQKRVDHALDYTEKLYKDEKGIFLVDDNFTTDRKRAEQILLNFSKTDFNGANLFMEARINDLLESNIIEICKNIPLGEIQVGVECGYDEGLRKIKKGLKIDNVRKFASLIKKHGILEYIHYGFIVGFPWETKEDCLRTIDFAYSLISEYGGLAYIGFFQLLPGSPLWDNREFYGIKERLEVYDSLFGISREFRLKISKIGDDDINEMINHIAKLQLLMLLLKGYGVISIGPPYRSLGATK